jgi:hypothetical protein
MITTEDRDWAEKQREIVRDKCPCDDCIHFDLCKKEEIACRSFAKFVLDNYYYVHAYRDPCKGIFNTIFNNKDDDILRRIVRGWTNEDKSKNNKGE